MDRHQENFGQALENAIIIPRLLQIASIKIQNIKQRAEAYEDREKWRKDFFLRKSNHPLNPEKMKDFFLQLADCAVNFTPDRIGKIINYANEDFLQELRDALIIPAEGNQDILFHEAIPVEDDRDILFHKVINQDFLTAGIKKQKKILADFLMDRDFLPAGIEEQKEILANFFSRYPGHPLSPIQIQTFVVTVRKMRVEMGSTGIQDENLEIFRRTIATAWLPDNYYPMLWNTVNRFTKAKQKMKAEDQAAILNLIK
jgi:hypothetical protein